MAEIEKIIRRNYYFALLLFWIKYLLLGRKFSTLVYSRGKTGTSTVSKTLGKHNIRNFQLHTLNPRKLSKIKRLFKENKLPFPDAILSSIFLIKKINIYKNIKIVCLVRDPVAIGIASYFQNRDKLKYSNSLELKKWLEERIVNFEDGSWFDSEIKYNFDIDVFAENFDILRGWEIYKRNNVSILVVKLENLGKCIGEIFEPFFGVQFKGLHDSNVGESKIYSKEYSEFKERFKLDHKKIESIYSSKYVLKFYSADEIKSFKEKWSVTDC